jgi:hypothetical protein
MYVERNHVRSIALAILGVEEFAKAIVFTVAAFRPDEHALLAKALFKEKGKNPELFRHEVKHLVTDIIEGALIAANGMIDGVEWDAGCSMDAWGPFHVRLLEVVAYGLKNLIPSHIEARAVAREPDEGEYGTS